MRSNIMKEGAQRAPQRSLLKAAGLSDGQIRRPLIGIANSFNEVVPGHVHLDKVARAVKDGVLMAGGTPLEFNTIAVCDGIAMGHEGMRYSLCTRELIADSIECMARAHCFDAMVFIPSCDKVVRHADGGSPAQPAQHLCVRRAHAVAGHGPGAAGPQQRV